MSGLDCDIDEAFDIYDWLEDREVVGKWNEIALSRDARGTFTSKRMHLVRIERVETVSDFD